MSFTPQQTNLFQLKDVAYGVVWEKKDQEKLNKFFLKCHNAVKHNERIEFVKSHFPWVMKWWHPEYEYKYQKQFRQFLEKRRDDHRVRLEGVEDLQFTMADDVVLYRGLEQCNKLNLAISTDTWTFIRIGTSGSIAYPYQTGLLAFTGVNFSLGAAPNYRQPNGTSLEFVVAAADPSSGTYREVAVTATSTTVHLTRNVMGTNMVHTQGSTTFSIAVIVEFVPVISSYG